MVIVGIAVIYVPHNLLMKKLGKNLSMDGANTLGTRIILPKTCSVMDAKLTENLQTRNAKPVPVPKSGESTIA